MLLTFFTQRNFVADSLQENCDLVGKRLRPFPFIGLRERTLFILGSLESAYGLPFSVN